MNLLVDKMHCLGIIKQRNAHEVSKETVCDAASKDCMFGDCRECRGKVLSVKDVETKTFYHKWCTKIEQR